MGVIDNREMPTYLNSLSQYPVNLYGLEQDNDFRYKYSDTIADRPHRVGNGSWLMLTESLTR